MGFRDLYYWLDLAVGFGGPLVVWALVRLGILGRRAPGQFALGCLVGLTWELPIFVGSFATEQWATIAFSRAPPVHWSVLMVSHTLWDGSLFLLGCLLVRAACGGNALVRYQPWELLLFVAYGQIQAVAVELSSTGNDAWYFVELWWNLPMFRFNDHDLTIFPQLFWIWGSLSFYFIWLRVNARFLHRKR